MESVTYRQLNIRNKLLPILLFLLTLPIVLLIQLQGMSTIILAALLVPMIVIFVYNTRIVLGIVILSLFIQLYFNYFSAAEYLTIFLIISFLITFKFHLSDIKTPLLFTFGIFILSIIPSYITSAVPGISLLLSLRLLVFFMTFTIVGIVLTNYKQISLFLKIFLFGALANGLYVIFLAATTGKRIFGFSGIMFVDLVSVAFVISFISFLYIKSKRIRYGILCLIFLSALIFTQTRGIWLITGVSTSLILFQALFYSEKVGVSKIRMWSTVLTSVLSIAVVVILLQSVNPSSFERVSVKKETAGQSGINSASTGSIVTRYFIWTTAWNAFSENPITGTGFYSFPFVSSAYNSLDSELYKLFVEDLTPHTTILALLAEAGLMGFTGFLIFLLSTLMFARRNFRNSKTEEQWIFSQIIFWISVYISLSMIVTDAWLWGVLIVLWGIVLGMSIANNKIIKATNTAV